MAYSPERVKEIVDFVCNEIADGKSLRSVLSNNEDMPARKTFLEWVENTENIRNQYARAMEVRAENIFEEILIISDSQEGDIIIVDGVEVTNHDRIQRAKLRVDSRKWMLGKMNPKKYGDRIQNDVNLTVEQPLFGNDPDEGI